MAQEEETKPDTSTAAVDPDPAGETDEEEEDEQAKEDEYEGGERGLDGERAKPGKKSGKKPNKNNPRENKLRKEFMIIDVDNSGFIDAKDLSKACGGYLPESYFNKAIKMIDQNRDGKISFEEYKAARGLAKSMKMAAFGGKDDNNKK